MDRNAATRMVQGITPDPAMRAAVFANPSLYGGQPAPVAAPRVQPAPPQAAPAAPTGPTAAQLMQARLNAVPGPMPLQSINPEAYAAEMQRRQAVIGAEDAARDAAGRFAEAPALPPMPSQQELRSMTLEQHRAAVDAARGVRTTRIQGGGTTIVTKL